MFAVPQEIKIISVTKLNRFAKQVLESEIGQVWVSGEISNFTRAASGHWYFTLKDDKAQVRTAMFRGANKSVSFTPKHGDKVVVCANISLYEARGDYQLIAVSMEPEGVGQLKQAFEALKIKLQQEGLFAHDSKQAMPKNINRIGIITSSTGAAVHDILHVLQRRNPAIEVVIYPSMVQGDGAAITIVEQIQRANHRNEVDVLVVGRGGGSLEDLWPFNEESVARAIFASVLPIVSAVGHEVDVTIADFVADVRAATPSAAAELLSTDKLELSQRLLSGKRMLMRAISDCLVNFGQRQLSLQQRMQMQHPAKKLQQNSQALDYLYARLQQQHPHKQIQAKRESLLYLQQRLQAQHPILRIHQQQKSIANSQLRLQQLMWQHLQRVKQVHASQTKTIYYLSPLDNIQFAQRQTKNIMDDLQTSMAQDLKQRQVNLGSVSAMLNTVSPLATLARGYSITLCDTKLVKSVEALSEQQTLTTKFVDGEVVSLVQSVSKL